MFKNLSTHQISLLTALTLTVVQSLFTWIFIQIIGISIPISYTAIWIALLFLLNYVIGLFFFTRYVYRRIKLLYKIIHKFKVGSKGKSPAQASIHEKIFENAELDVVNWADSQNKQLEELKTLENYRREFLGNVSHELKTPIFNVQGYLHTLLDGALYDEEINRTYLLRAAKNTERLQTIVEDLEAISKLESEEMVLDLTRFDIKLLAQEVIEDLELQASMKQVKLQFKDGADKHFMVKADKEYIRQVLNNLIANSIKYGKAGGLTKIGFYDMDRYILIEVADNGIGIEQKHLNHLFDRFYRVDKSRSREVGGSGLGLAIVKHIIEAHNQTINVRSTPGLGSTFGITLEKAS
jgi:two-component system, OmpR family, phosphate regulon sensor histidine kinase PhoR